MTCSGEKYDFNYVFLFTGTQFSKSFDHLEGKPGYFPMVVFHERLIRQTIPKEASVLVIGTKLSGIDALSVLVDNGH
eukprot:CAMPEP_0170544472 /NCGR_PEP_ID=MMETSP0211-20121228/3218_1 /TAXON_ID=311385 /ORGANISM="Pseudokeronopsis sp., Strain OXSARD2" /LENGTH=76 /DNA_ID=CAMNT_0010848129 /DNA_START=451 /DNA_END=681 /DNA_ORIENTATION=-